MALDPQTQAALALHRFGFGPRAEAIARIASDPRGALLAELERPGAGAIGDPDLLTSAEAAQAGRDFRQVRKAARLAQNIEREADQQAARNAVQAGARATSKAAADAPPAPDMSPGPDMKAGAETKPPAAAAARDPGPGIPQQIFLEEAKARLSAAAGADIGFAERLVWFWSNHFCISAAKGGGVAQLAGAYEREAIRPHVLGHFGDMLLAVETHPAMLLYLDNARSIGPNSPAGRAGGKGLNENLAREILELHTLGVRTVYSQADVTRFADVITGWTIVPPRADLPHAGEFTFNPRMHEPAAEKVIDKVYPDTGFEQGRAVLQALARHPATARHVATKLARHFVADDPPLALVDKLSRRFLETQGNLKEMAKTLIAAPESWAAPPRKLKRPGEWLIGMLRAANSDPPDVRPIMQAQNLLGEPLWRPPAPNGFADKDEAWIDGMAQRLDIATQAARRFGNQIDPKAVLDQALGPLASADTRQTINRAESRPQALALLFMAPEFQRR
ncbi:MAG TPA: DUF1800 family protein [Xanthobacteraceae bacterium]|jgi:uncharacterized protein (DUF1800 family)